MWLEHDAETLTHRPAFIYHLGDVVYFDGERSHYYDQFYEPYFHYPAPIFAIPGQPRRRRGSSAGRRVSLEGFMVNFCSPKPVVAGRPRCAAAGDDAAELLLDARRPLVTIIGLYTDVPRAASSSRARRTGSPAISRRRPREGPDRRAAPPAVLGRRPPRIERRDAHAARQRRSRRRSALPISCSAATSTTTSASRSRPPAASSRTSSPAPAATRTCTGWQGGRPAAARPWTDAGDRRRRSRVQPRDAPRVPSAHCQRHEIRGVYTTVPRPQESWSEGPVQQIDRFTIDIGSR